MLTRKQRRKEAKANKTEFVPQYNFRPKDELQENGQPLRVQHKHVLKIQKNEERLKEKNKNRDKKTVTVN